MLHNEWKLCILTSFRSYLVFKCCVDKILISPRWPLDVSMSSCSLDTQFLSYTCRELLECVSCMCLCWHVCARDQCTVCKMWRAPGDHLSDQLWAEKLSVVSPCAPAPAHEYSQEPKMLIIILRWLNRAAVRPHLLALPFRPNSLPHQLEIEKCPPPANHQYLWTNQQTRGIIYYNHVQVNKH